MENTKKRLLIVDDEIDFLTTLKFIFEEQGFIVTMVSSGIDALERIKGTNFDLVLLDINMPEMDGLETFRKIKKRSPITVIMMTGNKENVQIRKCIEEGAYTVIYKPFAVNNLLEIMRKALRMPVVLVVDDRCDDRVILRNLLELEGFRVVEAKDGMEAVKTVKKGNFDVCLVDFKMPGMDGIETIENIKEITPNIGVILMSAYTLDEAIKAEIKEKRGLAFIRKPYDINNLLSILNKELKKK